MDYQIKLYLPPEKVVISITTSIVLNSIFYPYHPALVKANSPAGSLGLGWNLLAGGYITRSVRGIIDEKLYRLMGNITVAPGYYSNAHRLKNINANTFPALNNHLLNQKETEFYELTADEFSFNFCGYSGNFYYNENGGWSVVSDQDIKVQFDPTTDGFISPDSLNNIQRIDMQDWDNKNTNSRFFNKFTLITPDGCQYEFGGPNATEYSAPYFHRKKSDLIPTTWRLSKIITVDKKVIKFEYNVTSIICDIKYVPQHKVVTNIPFAYHNPSTGRAGMTGYLLFPVNISQIRTPNEVIEFTYSTDAYFSNGFKINTKSYLGWLKPEFGDENRFDLYSVVGDNDLPYNQFRVFMRTPKGSTYSNDAHLCEVIGGKLKNLILKSIIVKDRGWQVSKKILFEYKDTPQERRKLTSIKEKENSNYIAYSSVVNISEDDIFDPGGFEISDPISRTFRFSYNTKKKLPASLIHPQADPWGYYNGNLINIFAADLNSLFNATPKNFDATMADILTEIEYPTGGKSRFEYEFHDFSKIVDISHKWLKNSNGTAGGLRIKKITKLSHADSIIEIKKYYYSDLRDTITKQSSGILSKTPVNFVTYTINANKKQYIDLCSTGGFFASVTSQNTPDVGYSCVIEETLNRQNKSEGYTRYRYTNFDQDIYGETHLDEPAWFCSATGESPIKAYSSHSAQRGKLLSEEIFDRDGELKKKVTYHYMKTDSSYFVTADQIPLYLNSTEEHPDIPVGTLTKTYLYSYLPDTLTEITYMGASNIPVENRQTFTYNTHKMLKKNTLRTSSDNTRTIEYEYNSDDPFNPYNGLGNTLSLLTQKSTTENGQTKKEIYTYSGVKGIPFLKTASTAVNDDFMQPDYEVVSVDSESLPIEINERGLHSVLLWGYDGQKLMAKIANVTFDQIESLPELAHEDFSLNVRLTYSQIESIRNKLPSAQFYIYKYNDRLLLQSAANPNGVTEFYNYDYLGRLTERYYIEKTQSGWQKRLLTNYVYNYQD